PRLTWVSQENSSGSVFTSQYAMALSFRAEWARQQAFDRGVDAQPFLKDRRDCRRDRHFDPASGGHFDQNGRREQPFGERRGFPGSGRRLGFAERDAERKIARLGARTGQNEVAESGKPGHGFGAGDECRAEADEFGKGTRDQGGAGARPHAAP